MIFIFSYFACTSIIFIGSMTDINSKTQAHYLFRLILRLGSSVLSLHNVMRQGKNQHIVFVSPFLLLCAFLS